MTKQYVSVASCGKTLRNLINTHYGYKPKPGIKAPKDTLESHKALSLLVELAVLGVKYKNENNCVLKSSLKLEEE